MRGKSGSTPSRPTEEFFLGAAQRLMSLLEGLEEGQQKLLQRLWTARRLFSHVDRPRRSAESHG